MWCSNRVGRLTRLAGIKAQIGYKRRPGIYGGRPAVAIDNTLDPQFDVAARDTTWVTDITYIRTCEGFAYRKRRFDPTFRISLRLLMLWPNEAPTYAITGFTHSTSVDVPVQRFEVFTGAGRRRNWSDEEKDQHLPCSEVAAWLWHRSRSPH